MKNKKLDWFFKYIGNAIIFIILLVLACRSLQQEALQQQNTTDNITVQKSVK